MVEKRAQIACIQMKSILTKNDPRTKVYLQKAPHLWAGTLNTLWKNSVGLTGLGSTAKHLVAKW
jgi:hypothetical protein